MCFYRFESKQSGREIDLTELNSLPVAFNEIRRPRSAREIRAKQASFGASTRHERNPEGEAARSSARFDEKALSLGVHRQRKQCSPPAWQVSASWAAGHGVPPIRCNRGPRSAPVRLST